MNSKTPVAKGWHAMKRGEGVGRNPLHTTFPCTFQVILSFKRSKLISKAMRWGFVTFCVCFPLTSSIWRLVWICFWCMLIRSCFAVNHSVTWTHPMPGAWSTSFSDVTVHGWLEHSEGGSWRHGRKRDPLQMRNCVEEYWSYMAYTDGDRRGEWKEKAQIVRPWLYRLITVTFVSSSQLTMLDLGMRTARL